MRNRAAIEAVENEVGSRPPRILLIEDDSIDARLVQRGLQRGNAQRTELVHVTRVTDGIARAGEQPFDLALLDLSLPDCQGLAGVQALKAACPDLPVVVLTGLDDEQIAARAIRSGAQDYLVKSDLQPGTLQRSIQHAIERNHMRAELAAAQARENELKDRFLSHVSHELRTPLTAILQFVTILQDGIAGPLTAQQAEILAITRRNTDQLKRMISTLMDVTRANTGKLSFVMQRLDLRATVAAGVDGLRGEAAKKNITIQFDPAGELHEVVADADRTVEVVSNLLENAIKFTPNGGRIQIVIAADADPRHCRVSVIDSGCGIDADHLDKVFDRLYQVGGRSDTSRRGLGLGLHISREIVTRQGGRIWAESQPGRGSRFQFTLPRFQLASLVRRVAYGGTTTGPSLSAIAVQIAMRGPAAQAKGLDGAVREVERMLTNCMVAGSDTVVPGAAPTGKRHLVLALARAHAAGGEAIIARLRGEICQSKMLSNCGFEVTVECWAPEVPTPPDGDVDAAAAELAELIGRKFEDQSRGG